MRIFVSYTVDSFGDIIEASRKSEGFVLGDFKKGRAKGQVVAIALSDDLGGGGRVYIS